MENKMDVDIRWMIRQRDMPGILDIENSSFEFPWTEKDFVRQANQIGMVAEYEGQIVGFVFYQFQKDYLRLLNLAVDADFRRREVGKQMVNKIIRTRSGRRRIVLDVRETNWAAQMFFKSLGFLAVSVLRDRYEDTPEDAYHFVYQFEQEERVEIANRISGVIK